MEPLSHIRVLDLTRARSGPTCIRQLSEMGAQTGIDLAQLIAAGRRAEEILGLRLRSNVILSGPVIHVESSPEKEPGTAIRPPA